MNDFIVIISLMVFRVVFSVFLGFLGGFFGAQSERREKGAIFGLKGRYGKSPKIGCITNDTPHPQGSFLG